MDFEGKFEAERLSRLEREGRILKQLADHEQDVSNDFDSERVSLGQAHFQDEAGVIRCRCGTYLRYFRFGSAGVTIVIFLSS